jgi:hypothetical protein
VCVCERERPNLSSNCVLGNDRTAPLVKHGNVQPTDPSKIGSYNERWESEREKDVREKD